jgi:serine/threonine protein kinase
MKAAYNEVTILSSLEHRNIIKYYESFMDDQDLYIVMQYAQKGDLHSVFQFL